MCVNDYVLFFRPTISYGEYVFIPSEDN